MKADGAMTEARARRELVTAGLRLSEAGLVARSWGNLSLRLGEKSMAITPSGIPYADLREEMIVVVDIETGEWSGGWKPSGERGLHRAIYGLRRNARAIVHTHQDAASVWAAARVPVKAPWGEVPCAPYALPGTKALVKGSSRVLGEAPAVLLANHGVFAVGADMDSAFGTVHALETACADLLPPPAGLSARADAPWDPSWLSPAKADDGSPAVLSRAPYTLAWTEAEGRKVAYLDDFAQLVGPSAPRRPKAEGPADPAKDRVVLVPGEGASIAGDDAEATAMVVEKNARAAILGAAIGGAEAIPLWEAMLMRYVYKKSYSKQAAKARRA